MKTLFIGKNCIRVEKTDSTNSFLARIASSPTLLLKEKGGKAVFEGTVVVARNQQQGRGQRGTGWQSEPGKNLTLSILLHPSFLNAEDQFQLNKAVSLGVAEFVLAAYSPFKGGGPTGSASVGSGDVRIKWPNDIYIGSKKVAGILIENTLTGNKLQQSIVGIGINVNQERFSAGLPNPTSLKLIAGKEFDLDQCLEGLCSCLEARYLELRAGQTEKLNVDYLKHLYRFGEWASYNYKGEALKAKITGVTKPGKLLLEKENGEKLECNLKEVGFA